MRDGVRRLGTERALYLRPMMWSREASPALIDALPKSTTLAICLEDLPMRDPGPLALTVSPFRRPPPDAALCEAKAACHYPNNARIIREARARGFQNALSLDQEGNVAETASTNVFLVRDGVVLTPAANGTFLNGITRQRVIALLRADGVEVVEAALTVADFATADEIFLTGNANKVTPVTRFEERELGPAPDGDAGAGALPGLRAREPEGRVTPARRDAGRRDRAARRAGGAACRGRGGCPLPAAGEILIRVHAAGVNRPDALQRAGAYAPPPGASDLPGLEAAGEVAAVGPGGSVWEVGDRCARCCRAAATPNTR